VIQFFLLGGVRFAYLNERRGDRYVVCQRQFVCVSLLGIWKKYYEKEVVMTNKKKKYFVHTKVFVAVLFIVVFAVLPAHSEANNEMCVNSDTCPKVIIDWCDTGVQNVADESNCTISDKIKKCAIDAKNHGKFVSCVSKLTNDLKKKGIITGREKGEIQSCAAKANVPCGDCLDIIPAPNRFCFEYGSDELSIALQKINNAYIYFPRTIEEVAEVNSRSSEGFQYLQQHPNEAATILIEEASRLSPENEIMLASIYYMLKELESPVVINYLFEQANRPLPTPTQSNENLRGVIYSLRNNAIGALGRRSAAGSQLAKQRLLDLVSSSDLHIKQSAIRVFYQSSKSRWRAKREMRDLLSPEDCYLLYEIY
jgi:hypothetical protein